jgi:hypothetical protein
MDWCAHRREATILRLEAVQVEPALDDRAQHLDFHRLLAKIVGPGGDRLERVLAFAVAGDDDHLGLRRDVLHLVQRGEAFADAVRIGRQPQIHDGDRRPFLLDQRNRLRPRMRQQDVAGGKRPAVLRAEALVVFDNQQLGFGHAGGSIRP